MSNPRKHLLALALAVSVAVPAWAEEPSAGLVVATVNGQEITLGHMIVMASQLPEQYQALPDDVLYDAVLDQLINQSAAADSVKDDLSTHSVLALENEERAFLASEALSRAAEAGVSEEAINEAYALQYEAADPVKEYNASHILVTTEEEAAEIQAQLEDGAEFATLAREKSTGPSGPSGGELGWFSAGMMVKPFEDAVAGMEVGAVSEPVQTQFGWHVIKLNETRDKPRPELESVRQEIIGGLQQAAVQKAIEEFTSAAEVTRAETDIDRAALRDMDLLDK